MEAALKVLLEKAKLEYEQELQTTQANLATYEEALGEESKHIELVKKGLAEVTKLLVE